MPKYKIERNEKYHTGVLIGFGVLLVFLVLLPFWGDKSTMRLATEMAGYLALAVMWNLLAGYAGVMSIGQQAFVGVGGYAVFTLAGLWGVPLIPSILLAGLVAGLLAIPVGLILFRLNGAYFAIGSWVMAEIFLLLTAQSDYLGAGSGMSFPTAVAKSFGNSTERAALFWWIALAIVIAALLIAYLWLRSSRGLALTAMRDDEVAASGLGVNVMRNKLQVFLVASAVAGLVGAILFLGKLRISPTSAYDVNEWTANIIFIVVIGGLGRLEGAVVGTIIFFLLRGFLADFGSYYLIILGLIAIITMLKMPQGVWGLIYDKTQIELFPLKRKIVN